MVINRVSGSDRCHCISRDTCVWRGEKIKESRKKRPMEGEGEFGCWASIHVHA
jgi:hypothetical protein